MLAVFDADLLLPSSLGLDLGACVIGSMAPPQAYWVVTALQVILRHRQVPGSEPWAVRCPVPENCFLVYFVQFYSCLVYRGKISQKLRPM